MKVKLIINPTAGKKRGRIPAIHSLTFDKLKEIYVPKESTYQVVDMAIRAFKEKKIDFDFEATEYQNDWDGRCGTPLCMGKGVVPEGTYFYELKIKEYKFNGYVVIKR